jgi:flavin-dependent dehydrogenase
MAQTDLLIVGAGPAGCSCAIRAAMAGLRVTMIAPARYRERPGETLHPGVEPVFDQLGLGTAVRNAGWLRHLGHRVGSNKQLIGYGSDAGGHWRGFQAPTGMLDSLLLERARAVGVAFLPHTARSLLVSEKEGRRRVKGVVTDAGPIPAKMTVDATGATRFAGRVLNLPRHMLGPRRTVYWGHLAYIPTDLIAEPHFQNLENGWLWRAPVNSSCCAWVWGPYGKPIRDSMGAHNELTRILGRRPSAPVRGASASAILLSVPPDCDGLLLAGDSAFSVTPLAGKGVLRSLLMGIAAADTARRIIDGGKTSSDLPVRYTAWTKQWFEAEADAIAALQWQCRE